MILRLLLLMIINLVLLVFLEGCTPAAKQEKQGIDYAEINRESIKLSSLPVRPGLPGEKPFWNKFAEQFIYAPAFDFNQVENATAYKFTLTASDSSQHIFFANQPWEPLSPVWETLPVGYVTLVVAATDSKEQELGIVGERRFYKAAPYLGPYHVKDTGYTESARLAAKYIYNLGHVQNWLVAGQPDDDDYELYCFRAKIIGGLISAMLAHHQLSPADDNQALLIARKAADYLLSISEPQGSPLEYFPPTYGGKPKGARTFKGQVLSFLPAEVAPFYLDLFDVTSDSSYFYAATRIADTYIKTQLPSGTWKLYLYHDGSPSTQVDCIPTAIITFLDRLNKQYHISKYEQMKELAFQWIMDNPVKTFDWTGHFDDVPAAEPYENLTKHEACSFAMILLDRVKENPGYLEIAEELIRFSEDQFVVWEKPMPHPTHDVNEWVVPSVLEQYFYREPIDFSVARLIETFIKAYRVTGKDIYKAKAIDLANSITVAQDPETGKYPTYWYKPKMKAREWLNCAAGCIKVMTEMDKIEN